MFFLKRAWYYFTRKIGKVVTIGIILFLVSTLVLTGLVIQTASASAAKVAKEKLGGSVIYSTDMSSLMPNKDEEGNFKDKPEAKEGFGITLPDDYTAITTKEIEYIANNSEYVKNYIINADMSAKAVSFSYYNPFGSNTNTNSNDRGFERREEANILINGLDTEKKNESFNTKLLTDGRYFTDEEISEGKNVIIIEQTIATSNDLKVGDKITVSKEERRRPGEDSTSDNALEIEFEIVGIYKTDNATDVTAGGFGVGRLSENTMYAPYTTILSSNLLGLEGDELTKKQESYAENGYEVTNVTFNLKDSSMVDAFIKEVESMKEIDTTYRSLNANDEAYEKMVGPIENVASTSTVLVVVVVIAGALIIGLLSMLSIKDRKYELGVLLSLGESRFKIVAQLVCEMLMVAIIAFGLAAVVSNFTAQATTNYLLNQELTNEQTNIEDDFGNRRGDMGHMMMNKPGKDNMANMDVETIESLTVSANVIDIIKMLGIGIIIIIIGNTLQALFVLKANPKQIMLER